MFRVRVTGPEWVAHGPAAMRGVGARLRKALGVLMMVTSENLVLLVGGCQL